MWEDEVNQQGSEFQVIFKGSISLVQKIWDTIVFSLLSGEFAETDMLAGIRLLDKTRDNNEIFRIEVWTKVAEENDPINQTIKKYIQEKFVDGLVKSQGGEVVKYFDIGFQAHKAMHGGKDSYKDHKRGPRGD